MLLFTSIFFWCSALAAELPADPPLVVFVHGMFVRGDCWDGWRAFFEERGYATVAPDWPGRQGDPAALRAEPDPVLRELTLDQVVEQYAALVRAQPKPPILIGHSMGGLVVQRLLDQGLGSAGVVLDSAPPKGVTSYRFSFLKFNGAVLAPTRAPLNPSERKFHYGFTHGLTDEDAAAAYQRYAVPESRRVGRGPTTRAGRVDFDRERAPLLLVAGGDDRIIPPGLTRRNHAHQDRSPSRTDLRTFDHRTHWILAEPGWEEVAGAAVDWLREVGQPGAAVPTDDAG